MKKGKAGEKVAQRSTKDNKNNINKKLSFLRYVLLQNKQKPVSRG